MKAGRPAQHAFNDLKIGQKALLKGSAASYPHQYIRQYSKKDGRKLKLIHEGKKLFVERIA